MNIRPIDLQALVPQTLEVGKVKALDNLQLSQNQQTYNEKLQKEADHKQKKVVGTDKSEGKIVRNKDKDSESEKSGSKKRDKKDTDAEEENKMSEHPKKVSDGVRGIKIDISY